MKSFRKSVETLIEEGVISLEPSFTELRELADSYYNIVWEDDNEFMLDQFNQKS